MTATQSDRIAEIIAYLSQSQTSLWNDEARAALDSFMTDLENRPSWIDTLRERLFNVSDAPSPPETWRDRPPLL